jgi:hypothetical protein
MIRLFRIIGVGAASPANWVIGQFDTAEDALAEYNSEFWRAKSEGIDDGRPELEFVTDNREVEYFLAEEELTHTPDRRDEGVETGRWVWLENKAFPSGCMPEPAPRRKNSRL